MFSILVPLRAPYLSNGEIPYIGINMNQFDEDKPLTLLKLHEVVKAWWHDCDPVDILFEGGEEDHMVVRRRSPEDCERRKKVQAIFVRRSPKDMNRYHKEAGFSEVFLCNGSCEADFITVPLLTKRKGKEAFNPDQELLKDMFPIFADRDELIKLSIAF